MSAWKPIESAPKDGTLIRLKCGRRKFLARWSDIGDSASWASEIGEKPPPCWTDDYCWSSNADGVPSKQPTHWEHP
jgi:hypothetical protein